MQKIITLVILHATKETKNREEQRQKKKKRKNKIKTDNGNKKSEASCNIMKQSLAISSFFSDLFFPRLIVPR